MQTNRNVYIDIVKSFAIFMVVLGHCLQYTLPDTERFSNTLFIMIYSMHMPLFIAISGYLFYYQTKKYSCKELVKNKLRTIGLPAMSFSILIVLAQLTIMWLKGDFAFGSLINCVGNYFIKGVWFLWALLIISLVYSHLVKYKLPYILVGTILMIPISFIVPNVSILNWCIYLAPFFGLGYIVNRFDIPYRISKNKFSVLLLSAIVWCFTLQLMYNKETFIYNTGTYIFVSDINTQVMRDIIRVISGCVGSCTILLLIDISLQFYRNIAIGDKNKYVKMFIVNPILLLGRKTLHIYAISMCLINTIVCTIISKLVSCYPLAIFLDVVIVLFVCILGSKIISMNKMTRLLFSGSRT